MQVNVMKVALYHTLQLTCCLHATSCIELGLFELCLHGCYMKRESVCFKQVLICALCDLYVSGLVEDLMGKLI